MKLMQTNKPTNLQTDCSYFIVCSKVLTFKHSHTKTDSQTQSPTSAQLTQQSPETYLQTLMLRERVKMQG